MATGIRKAGEFCWINMLTPNPAAALPFFAQALGWTYVEMPGFHGHRIQVDGHDIGGMFDLAGPQTPPGLLPCIGVMVKVASADATCARVAELGGKANPAFDIGPQGRMAVCFDPTGAEFDVWEPRAMPGTDVDSRAHGAPSWFEAMTPDVARASAFYAALFGWTTQAQPMGDFDYTLFNLGGAPVAGMMPILPNMGPIPPHWGTYFAVRDADAAAREAAAAGGTLFIPPTDIPHVGRFSGIVSPQGVRFYVLQYAG
jgi:predicted enzyme related to lactoylglutathione lyase